MDKLTYQIHELMSMRHAYYYNIHLPDLLPRQKKLHKQSPHMVTLDYKSGKIIPVSAFILLQPEPLSLQMQTSPRLCPPIWSPPLSSMPHTLSPTFQNSDFAFRGLMVPVLNIDQELSVQCKESPLKRQSHPPTWYNSPISPPAPSPFKSDKKEVVVLSKSGDLSSCEDTSSDDIVIQIHSSSPNRLGSKDHPEKNWKSTLWQREVMSTRDRKKNDQQYEEEEDKDWLYLRLEMYV